MTWSKGLFQALTTGTNALAYLSAIPVWGTTATLTPADGSLCQPRNDNYNGRVYVCVNPGGTGTIDTTKEPTWPLDASLVTDSGVKWYCPDSSGSDATAYNYYYAKSGVDSDKWATATGDTYNSNHVQWMCMGSTADGGKSLAASVWTVGGTHSVGDIIYPATPTAYTPTGHYYLCITKGTSGTTPPTWSTSGGKVTDGDVVWIDMGKGPNWSTTDSAYVNDGAVRWQEVDHTSLFYNTNLFATVDGGTSTWTEIVEGASIVSCGISKTGDGIIACSSDNVYMWPSYATSSTITTSAPGCRYEVNSHHPNHIPTTYVPTFTACAVSLDGSVFSASSYCDEYSTDPPFPRFERWLSQMVCMKDSDNNWAWKERAGSSNTSGQWDIVGPSGSPYISTIGLNETGEKIAFGFKDGCSPGTGLWKSSDYGTNYTAYYPHGGATTDANWIKVALDYTGDKIGSVALYDYLYTSTDFGANWAVRLIGDEGTFDWRSITISPDGSTIFASPKNDYIFKSTNYGATWSAMLRNDIYWSKPWKSISSSENGSKLIVTQGDPSGSCHTYDASTSTWSDAIGSPLGTNNWRSVEISPDGTKMAACAWSDYVYTYNCGTDAPGVWSKRLAAGTGVTKSWYDVSISSDGTKVSGAAAQAHIYTSIYGGAQTGWTTGDSSTSLEWSSVAISGNGSRICAVASADYLYTSVNDGSTWNKKQPAGSGVLKDWRAVSVSNSGYYVATAAADQIYTTTNLDNTSWCERGLHCQRVRCGHCPLVRFGHVVRRRQAGRLRILPNQ